MLKETSKPGSKVNKTKSLFIDKIWRIEAKFKNFINLATPLTNLKHTHVRPIKVKRRHNSGKTKEAFSSLGLSIKHPYGVLYIWNFSIAFVVFLFLKMIFFIPQLLRNTFAFERNFTQWASAPLDIIIKGFHYPQS